MELKCQHFITLNFKTLTRARRCGHRQEIGKGEAGCAFEYF
ncbi:hypothetical protein CLOSTASPAR_05680 [[Clostridium] asparagiforme DSM 15981]|uniref:Uncharacterized protein n=1 Tax=[Clostridium] asparagiforme DSM 15981 TaxID=518636 RepID=C0D8T1_9FIRM|nr:hypothetical protein CLOSTASPAR_05680 [[Clostridium] asparagiforme DSM 15981]